MTPPARPLTLRGMTWRNLYRQKVRTCLTALGVSIGVVSIVAFTSIVRGLWKAVNASIKLDGGEMIVFQAGIAGDFLSVLEEKETEAKLLADPAVESAIPALGHFARVGDSAFTIVIGMHIKDIELFRRHLIDGRIMQNEDEILLGYLAAKATKKKVGDQLEAYGRTFRVAGIFRNEVVFHNGALVMSLPLLQELTHRENQATLFQLRLRPGEDTDEVMNRIEHDRPELALVADASQYGKVDVSMNATRSSVWAVGFMAVVIGAVIVTNTMWMSVHERTREIGVLRALGWSKRGIIGMIMIESTGVGMIACVVGCVLGVGLAELTTHLPMMNQFVSPTYDAVPFLLALAVAILLSLLGGAVPAWRAARISPVEALRYE